jgi:drug/metabolite transporter (DMT)-like permease
MLDGGELAALATALSWTASSFTFAVASRRVGGLPTNQFRLLVAVPGLLLLHLALHGSVWPGGLPTNDLLWLAGSGIAGLVLGDIGFFFALSVIGPRQSSVLMATWPAIATAITVLRGGPLPTVAMLGGVVLTMTGVMLVVLRGSDGVAWRTGTSRGRHRLAIAGALFGALGQAVGAVIVSDVAAHTQVTGLGAALVRMVAAAVGILAVTALSGRALAFKAVAADRRTLGHALLGTAFGPVLGVWASMVALGNTDVGKAAAIIATTPIFMMPVAKVAYGARIGVLGVLGTLLAVAGVAVLKLA